MCQECGCEAKLQNHPHDHGPVSDHVHPTQESRTIELETRVLSRNDAYAQQNRHWLEARNICAINLISSPGSGKTRLLERTLDRLQNRIPIAVIAGDVCTDHDARRLQNKGASILQIETLNACHLDAHHIAHALPQVITADTRLLFIENVGNLVCPSAFDLGEKIKVALISVTEGEDKPLKYPSLFHQALVTVITKTDLVPHLDWDMGLCRENIHKVRADARIFELSAHSGEGMNPWLNFLEGLAQ